MGILDDLAMGFGMKERTADYDARTARTVAANEAAARRGDATDATFLAQARNPRHSSYIGDDYGSSGGARIFLDRVGARGGYEAGGDNPSPVDDTRPFIQRALFSPESTPSPSPYAIGPMQMDQPLPAFGVMGLIKALAGGPNKNALPSGAITALDSGTLKAPNQIARAQGILTADDGQITEEELADVTEAPEDEFAGMSNNEITRTLISRYNSDDVPPIETYSYLFDDDPVYKNLLKTKSVSDQAVAIGNRLAGM